MQCDCGSNEYDIMDADNGKIVLGCKNCTMCYGFKPTGKTKAFGKQIEVEE